MVRKHGMIGICRQLNLLRHMELFLQYQGFIAEGFLPIGIALYLVMGVLIYFSFRPYWQINKSYVTGKAGKLEKVISIAGDGTARMAEYAFKA